MRSAEILLHPIRLRVVLAMGPERMTTSELAERLPDVAHATLYRQVATLADAGLLEVVDERQVRGGMERTYALVTEAAQLTPEDVAAMSAEELQRGFIIFAGSLIATLGRYLEDPRAKPAQDALSYRQAALWLTEEERRELIRRLRSLLGPFLEHGPGAQRQRVLLSTILIPDLTASADDATT